MIHLGANENTLGPTLATRPKLNVPTEVDAGPRVLSEYLGVALMSVEAPRESASTP